MRRAVSLTAAAALAAGLSAFGTTSAHAQDENSLGEFSFTIAATQAQVNAYGGITVSGTMSCVAAIGRVQDAAVDAAEDASLGPGPLTAHVVTYGGGVVGANPNYTVTQYVGKTRANSAQYNSGIQQPCYTEPNTQPSYPWKTLYPYPSGGTQQWLYSATGKFTPGSIHVELIGETHINIVVFDVNGQQVGSYTASLYAFAGSNIKATAVKAR